VIGEKEPPVTITTDPENSETNALFEMVDLGGQHVLEIGCGDGRFTWRYADKAARVTAIDPSASQIAVAREQMPARLRDRVELQAAAFEDFAAGTSSRFDVVILSWSLC
jgi:cyclopropane fatty-acyl-phospholipid synthase-like methyltransferase